MGSRGCHEGRDPQEYVAGRSLAPAPPERAEGQRLSCLMGLLCLWPLLPETLSPRPGRCPHQPRPPSTTHTPGHKGEAVCSLRVDQLLGQPACKLIGPNPTVPHLRTLLFLHPVPRISLTRVTQRRHRVGGVLAWPRKPQCRGGTGTEAGAPCVKLRAARPGVRPPGRAVLTAGKVSRPMSPWARRLHREALHQAAAPDAGPQVLPPPPEDAGAAGPSPAARSQLPVGRSALLQGHALRALPGGWAASSRSRWAAARPSMGQPSLEVF